MSTEDPQQYKTAFEGMIESYNAKEKALHSAERIIDRRDTEIEKLRIVVDELADRIMRTRKQIHRDMADGFNSECHELLTLLGDPEDVKKIANG